MTLITPDQSKILTTINNDNLSLREKLKQHYELVRAFSERLCENLETEDYVVQSMPDVSPVKWHLAHTSWFFETFLLAEWNRDYKPPNELYTYLFNSYYVQVGERFNRPSRGLLSRPTVRDVYEYRKIVDAAMEEFFEKADDGEIEKYNIVINIGLHHEQQHQELILTDIKHVFAQNPINPVLSEKSLQSCKVEMLKMHEVQGGLFEFGYNGDGFFYDNEKPVHKHYLNDFYAADRLITNSEYIEFIEDNGYLRSELWLSNGMAAVENNKWKAPGYWEKINGEWFHYTLNGFRKVNPDEPVCHVSYYEADAFARWAQARLLTEFEFEKISRNKKLQGNFVESGLYNVAPVNEEENFKQLYGDVWEWTMSDYASYPGYKIPEGAIGEYNGKFMSGQYVLRGGSCATSISHIRNTYRNFFPPDARWQFTGIRLAKDIG